MRTLLQALLWRRVDVPGTEHFRLWQTPDGPRLEGTVVTEFDGVPLAVRYAVACSAVWETRAVQVEVESGAENRTLELAAEGAGTGAGAGSGEWWVNGRRVGELAGCEDVDLGITPSTNTLPIRRLALGVGEEREVTAAWVRFPDLAVIAFPQRYTRVADGRYRYESRGGDFTADLETDELGLVVNYSGLWERVR